MRTTVLMRLITYPSSRPKKRLFFGLAVTTWLLAATSAMVFWRLIAPGLAEIHASLPMVAALALGACMSALGLGMLGMVLATLGFRPPVQIARSFAWWVINLVFRPAILLGRLVHVPRERIERSFIEISNHIVRGRQVSVLPSQLLLLLPHCLQLDRCGHKITNCIQNCKRCGKCSIGSLADVAGHYRIHIAVVPGGTLARQVIQSLRPRAVLAVACERDLVSGIQDVFPMPVIGVLNDRPQGPCCNTAVDLGRLEEAIRSLLDPHALPVHPMRSSIPPMPPSARPGDGR